MHYFWDKNATYLVFSTFRVMYFGHTDEKIVDNTCRRARNFAAVVYICFNSTCSSILWGVINNRGKWFLQYVFFKIKICIQMCIFCGNLLKRLV